MKEGHVADAVAALHAALPGQVRTLVADIGDRVTVTVGEVQATGTIGTMGYHWHTEKGLHVYPVVLDGTGQTVEVHTKYLATPEGDER